MSDTLVYPIEIRPGVFVKIQMPVDITDIEIDKVGRIMTAIYDIYELPFIVRSREKK